MPIWLPIMIAGTAALSAYQQRRAGQSAAQAAQAERRAAESMAELSDYNAAVAEIQARDSEQRGELEANRFRTRAKALIGEQRAGFAAGNVDVGWGSTIDVQADTSFLGELDALTVKTNAAREAWGFRVEAYDLRQRAMIQRREGIMLERAGRSAQSQASLGAATTLLGAATSILEAKYGWGRR